MKLHHPFVSTHSQIWSQLTTHLLFHSQLNQKSVGCQENYHKVTVLCKSLEPLMSLCFASKKPDTVFHWTCLYHSISIHFFYWNIVRGTFLYLLTHSALTFDSFKKMLQMFQRIDFTVLSGGTLLLAGCQKIIFWITLDESMKTVCTKNGLLAKNWHLSYFVLP